MDYIKGVDRNQTVLLPESLDEYVNDDNPVRFLDAYVDSLDLRELGFKYAVPKGTGRPSYDPGDMLKLYLYGYLNRPRSSRKLELETYRNVEVMWLLRRVHPDFKTIADFRKDNLEALKKVCRDFTILCKKLDLFGCQLVGIDGSKFKAVNHNHRNYSEAKIKKILEQIDERIAEYFGELDKQDELESKVTEVSAEDLQEKIKELKTRKDTFLELKEKLKESGQTQISLTDPDSRSMRTGSNGTDMCYNVQFAVDDKHKLIVAHDVTNDTNDLNQLANMALKAKEILETDSLDVAVDMGYYDGLEVKKCEDENITCYMPKPKKSNNRRLGLYTNDDFEYDAENDCYICLAKERLSYRSTVKKGGKLQKVYHTKACQSCPLKAKCTRSKAGRLIYRWVHEELMEQMQQRVLENPEKVKKRKELVEHPFGTIKHWMGQGHFLLRGIEKVSGEMSLTVLAYNIKRVTNIVGVKELIKAVN